MARLPAVLHLRGVPAIGRAYWAASQLLADRFILVAKALEPYFAPSARPRCRVVYNGVRVPAPIARTEARAAVEGKLRERGVQIDPAAKLFVSVSSPTPFKGLHHLLDAAALLRERGLNAHFLCAGAGNGDPYEGWLSERIARAGMEERFTLLGFWDDVHGLLSSATATVLPTVDHEELVIGDERRRVQCLEGLPRAVLESFAAGVPVVATRVAGVAEQIDDGVTGHIVAPSDPRALADALEHVARDGSWAADAGARGREVVSSKFTVSSAARGLASVLKEVATRPSPITRVKNGASLIADLARGA